MGHCNCLFALRLLSHCWVVCPYSNRVSIGSKNGGRFNSIPTDGSDRIRRFDQLLSGPVGKQLCRMYARYWQPDDLAHYFEEAALYSRNHKSTVSITDSVSAKTLQYVCVRNSVYMNQHTHNTIMFQQNVHT